MLGSAVAGGVIGGLVVWWLVRPAEVSPEPEPARASAAERRRTPDEDADRRARALAGRVNALERKSAAAAELGKYARQMAANDDAGDDSPERLSPVVDAEDPVFGLAVRSVLDRVEWERDEERRVTRAQRQQLRVARQADFLAEKLNLTSQQKDEVSKIFEEQAEKFQALRRPPDGGPRPVTRRGWREQTGAIRAQTDTALGEVLDEQQMKDYQALQEEEDFGGGPRRGGRRRR